MDGLTEGRMVHFVMPNGEHRPAIITRVWDRTGSTGCANLSVFTDYTNDSGHNAAERNLLADAGIDFSQVAGGHIWKTSQMYSEERKPGTWHWIEKA